MGRLSFLKVHNPIVTRIPQIRNIAFLTNYPTQTGEREMGF
jgi:hypothetical protein